MSDLISREAALAILHECGGDEIYPPNMIEMRGRMLKLSAIDAVVLPCKLGDKLYSVDGKTAEVEEFLVDKRGILMTLSFECDYNCEGCAFNSWRQEYCGEYSCDGEWGEMTIPATELGKSLFRTYEEAKAELWKRREEQC